MHTISVSVKAAIVRDGRVLLMSFDDEAGFHYNLPGGKAKDGEPLREAVHRKVAEETGLEVQATRLLFVVEYVPARWDYGFGSVHKTQHNFLVEETQGSRAPRMSEPRDPDQIGFEWVAIEQLATTPLLPRVAGPLRAALRSPLPDPLVDIW